MEGGYARWWEVVVQGRVTGLYSLGAKVTSEVFLFYMYLYLVVGVLLASVTLHISSHWREKSRQ